MADLPSRARVVVVGGGVIGTSVAYHLTRMGRTDVLLLEQGRLSSGTTWHAAGLVGQLRASESGTRLVQYSAELYARLEEETGQATGYKQVGGVIVARTVQQPVQHGNGDATRVVGRVVRLQPARQPPLQPDRVAEGRHHQAFPRHGDQVLVPHQLRHRRHHLRATQVGPDPRDRVPGATARNDKALIEYVLGVQCSRQRSGDDEAQSDDQTAANVLQLHRKDR